MMMMMMMMMIMVMMLDKIREIDQITINYFSFLDVNIEYFLCLLCCKNHWQL